MNGKPQKEMATQMATRENDGEYEVTQERSFSLGLQQQIIKALYPTFNTDFSLTLKKEQIISIYYGI